MTTKDLVLKLAGDVSIGHHQTALKTVEEFLRGFSDVTVGADFIRAEINKNADTTVLLDAHIDEVGFVITNVSKDGFLTAASVGSIDGRILSATKVKVLTDNGEFSGVFTSTPPHLSKGEETVPSLDTVFIDVGENAKYVSVGDYAVFDAPPLELLNGKVTSKSLDDRAGVTAVLIAAKKIAESNCNKNAVIIISSGEELGLRGARTSCYNENVDCSISVDVSFGDYPDIPSHKTAKLGSGTMIGVSPVLSRDVYKELQKKAEENNIPYTLEVMGGTTSTNADIISLTKSGIPAGLLSIPLRNMHTPTEVVDIKDIDATADLIFAFLGGKN